MKNNWQTKKLGEICNIELGKTPFRANKSFWDEDKITKNIWLSIADLLNASDNIISTSREHISDKGANISKIVKAGTLLVSFKLTLGRLAFAGINLYTNEAIAALTIKNENELVKKYLYYFLSGFDWMAAADGDIKIKGKTLNKAKLKEILITFPKNIPEQKRIVSILEKAFAAIEKAKENAEKNKRSALTVFNSYLENIFNNPNNEWHEKTLGEIIKLEYGKPLSGSQRRADGAYPVYGANGEKNKSNEYYYDQKSIIVGRKGSAGELKLTEEKFWPLDVTYFVTMDQKKYDLKFIYYILKNLKLPKLAKGVKPGINRNEVYSLKVYAPSLPMQYNIVTKLDNLLANTQNLDSIYQKKLTLLEELKKSTLHKAFNGELTQVKS